MSETLSAAEVDQPHPLLRHLRTAEWLDAQEFPPLSWAVTGLIPEGMALLAGGPKIGKSWLAYGIALAVASGGRALGTIAVQPRPVLLLALEDGDRRLQDRGRELMGADPLPALLSYLTRIEPGTVVATIEAWLSTLPTDAAEPLVIVDTLGKVMPPAVQGESPYQRDYRVAGRLKRICDDRPGMALLVLHHDRKAESDDFVDSVSGTNGIAGAADTIIVISRPRNEDRGLFKVTGRDVPEREYAVKVDAGGWQLIGDDLDAATAAAHTVRATANLGDRSAELVRYAARHPQGIRAKDVVEALGMDAAEARTYLGRLLDAGRLRRPERGLYTPVMSVASVASLEGAHAERNGSHVRNTPPPTHCAACGDPLHEALIAAGESTHPTCGGER